MDHDKSVLLCGGSCCCCADCHVAIGAWQWGAVVSVWYCGSRDMRHDSAGYQRCVSVSDVWFLPSGYRFDQGFPEAECDAGWFAAVGGVW